MDLFNFCGIEKKVENKEEVFKQLVEKYKLEGMTDEQAIHEAELFLMKPVKLEKVVLKEANVKAGERPHIQIFYDSQEELDFVGKYLKVSQNGQVASLSSLINILKENEENKKVIELIRSLVK